MKLPEVIAEVGPLLEGQRSHADTVAALHLPEPSAARLDIYRRFCAGHRLTALSVFSATRRLYVEDHGEEAWATLADKYFAAHPMFHTEINTNGGLFADFLKALTDDDAFDDVYGDVADFEWWQWYTDVQPDQALDGDGLRISPLVDIRSYAYDVLSWMKGDREGRPASKENFVVFWRDRDGDARWARLSARELGVVRLVHLAEPIPDDWSDTLADLVGAGILLK